MDYELYGLVLCAMGVEDPREMEIFANRILVGTPATCEGTEWIVFVADIFKGLLGITQPGQIEKLAAWALTVGDALVET